MDKKDELISGCLLSDEGVVLQNKVFENWGFKIMSFISLLWVLLLGSLLGLELIGKVPPTLHTPLMSGANAISGITMLAALTLIVKAEGNLPLLIIGSVSLGFALFNVVGGFFVTDRMLAMFSRKPSNKK